MDSFKLTSILLEGKNELFLVNLAFKILNEFFNIFLRI